MSANRTQYNFRFPSELMGRIDRVRGEVSRTAWIEQAVDEKLAGLQVMGLYRCPVCEFRSDNAAAVCAAHGRKVSPA